MSRTVEKDCKGGISTDRGDENSRFTEEEIIPDIAEGEEGEEGEEEEEGKQMYPITSKIERKSQSGKHVNRSRKIVTAYASGLFVIFTIPKHKKPKIPKVVTSPSLLTVLRLLLQLVGHSGTQGFR